MMKCNASLVYNFYSFLVVVVVVVDDVDVDGDVDVDVVVDWEQKKVRLHVLR